VNSYRLVYISGWAADEHAWARVLDDVEREVTRVHVPWWDCLTPRAEDSALVRCLAEDDTPTIVAAWSLGVLAALPALSSAASHVLGAVLAAGTARMPSEAGYPGADPRIIKAMRLRVVRKQAAVLEEFAKRCTAPHDDAAFVSDFVRHGESIPAQRLQEGLRYLEERDARDDVHGIQVPTVALHGECDQVIPTENGKWLADSIPAAQFTAVPHVSHALLHEAPCLVGRAIRSVAHAE
jgi:pimeloyl-ACP methyl ester carboxylesterase